jgi:NADPH:quinone reductase-like Zn-dependent oxidoreductase/acyl carrier protein
VLAQELRNGAIEPEMMIRRGLRYVPRLSRETAGVTAPRTTTCTRLEPQPRGVLDNLKVVPAAQREPGPGEVEILVRATGLNFRDVLNALGMYPGEAGALGDECAGTVSRVGPGVNNLKAGDEVVGIAHGSFASHAVAAANLLVKRPSALTSVDAVTAPITFLTAEYSLHHIAKIKAGDRVLVHAAAGGVGLAAIQIAREAGAEIFATAGSAEKHAFLRSMGVEHIFSSRTPDFVDEIRRRTAGRGVDVVVNSLIGDFIPRSLDVLAKGGRFVEIGRTGIWEPERVRQSRPDVEYTIVFMGDVFRDEPVLSRRMLVDIFARLERGALKPLPVREFGMDEAVAAFRYVAQARHIGKVVVTQAPAARQPVSIRPASTYLISGGLGALGLHVARWLVSRGARNLVLAGRRAPDAAARAAVQEVEQAGATVRLVQVDLGRADSLDQLDAVLANLPPLGGVFHAAGVVDDGMLQQQDWNKFVHVFAPKAVGAQTTGRLAIRRGAEFVVLFSSGASILGSRGQANYAAANAFLDAFVWELRAQGLRAWSINWGAWSGAGMTASLSDRDRSRTRSHGHHFIEPTDGVAALDQVLTSDAHPQIAVLPIDWPQFLDREAAGRVRPIVSRFTGETPRANTTTATSRPTLADRMGAASPSQRREMLSAHIRETAITVLGLPASYPLDAHQGLRDVGLDSLMAVELKNRLQDSTKQTLPATLAFDYPTVAALTKFLGQLLQIDDNERERALDGDDGRAIAELAELSDEEAEALLAEELAALNKGTGHGH